jgi:hypothetical protein
VFTLRHLCTPSTLVFLCQTPRRPKIERRFYKMAEKYFRVQLIRQVAAVEASGERRDVQLMRLQLKEAPAVKPRAQKARAASVQSEGPAADSAAK